MTEWVDALNVTRERFVEQLEQRGLILQDETTLLGVVETEDGPQTVKVKLLPEFPFRAPKVYPDDAYPRSWHRERDGAMCLYGDDRHEELPWLNPGDFITMVGRWFDESANGWSDDFPILDLDRYFPSSDEHRLIVFGDLGGVRYVKFKNAKLALVVSGPSTASASNKNRRNVKTRREVAAVLDIGTPDLPPTTWQEVLDLCDEAVATEVAAAAESRRIGYALVQYQRGAQHGVLALALTVENNGSVTGESVDAASNLPTDLTLRAGEQQALLQTKRVIVLGAGALGSHICDGLARAGVRRLTVVDHGTVEPGNLVRHTATEKHVGWSKVDAVKDVIESRPFNQTVVTVRAARIINPLEIPDLLEAYDLLVDATASGPVTAMLTQAATIVGARLVSACLQDNGTVVRVDVIPSEPQIPATVASQQAPSVGYATGCGDPVSLTPPYAVAEAAALAVRHAVALLVSRLPSGAGVVNDYR